LTPTTFRSDRLRVTLPSQERAYLHWLAIESGNDDVQEAGLLLKMGIRLAMRRYRRLYGGLPVEPADQETLEKNTPREAGDDPPAAYHRLPDHSPIGGFDVNLGDPPLVLPEWDGLPDPDPHRERGFGRHERKEKG